MDFTNNIDPEQLYISVTESCRALNLTQNDIRRAMLAKEVTWDVVGGRLRLYRASVEDFVPRLDAYRKSHNLGPMDSIKFPIPKIREVSHV